MEAKNNAPAISSRCELSEQTDNRAASRAAAGARPPVRAFCDLTKRSLHDAHTRPHGRRVAAYPMCMGGIVNSQDS